MNVKHVAKAEVDAVLARMEALEERRAIGVGKRLVGAVLFGFFYAAVWIVMKFERNPA